MPVLCGVIVHMLHSKLKLNGCLSFIALSDTLCSLYLCEECAKTYVL